MTLSELLENPMDPGLKAAIKEAGGVRPLARLIGVSHPSIIRWTKIPVSHLFKIEKATGVPREKLRPDIFLAPRPK